jgi:hypothetical protein
MKITKPGEVPDDYKLKGKCTYCGCEFEFHGVEAVAIRSPWGEDFWSVKCPQVGCWFICTIKK